MTKKHAFGPYKGFDPKPVTSPAFPENPENGVMKMITEYDLRVMATGKDSLYASDATRAAHVADFYHGFCHRFCIRSHIGRDGAVAFMVHDAEHVTDSDIAAGHRSPVVAQFATAKEARDWCDLVEAGKLASVPHESNFEGWPELRARVTGISQGERERRARV